MSKLIAPRADRAEHERDRLDSLDVTFPVAALVAFTERVGTLPVPESWTSWMNAEHLTLVDAGLAEGVALAETSATTVSPAPAPADPSVRPDLADMAERLRAIAERLPDVPTPADPGAHAVLVTEKHLATLTGYGVDRLETMRRRAVVKQGVHWFKTPKGGIVWDTAAFDAWQRGA